MWVIPSACLASVPASVVSTWGLRPPTPDECASSLTWSGSTRPVASWRRAWETDVFQPLRSGQMSTPSRPSVFEDWWTASLAVTPVSPSHKPDGVEAPRTRAISGPPLPRSWTQFALFGACSRTSPAICTSADTRSSETYKRWVMRLRRHSLQRRKLVRPIDGNGCSCWHTTQGGRGARGSEWLTPSARDWKDTPGMSSIGRNPDGTLRTRVDMLPRQVFATLPVHAGRLIPMMRRDGPGCWHTGRTSLRPSLLARAEELAHLSVRVNPRFVAWLMGLPPDWVQELPWAVSLQVLGNAVVPQQAAHAVRVLWGAMFQEVDHE